MHADIVDPSRLNQAENARKTRPWEHSTGPHTEEGKNAVKMNSLKHGMRAAPMREFVKLLTQQRKFIKGFNHR